MSKNAKTKAKAKAKVKTNKQTTAKRGPGRPKYVPTIPRGKFTFAELEAANGVDLSTGKGGKCTTLTLRKWMKREIANRRNGAVMLVKDILAEPNSASGLGRKQYVYIRRPAEKSPQATKPRKETSPAPTTADYEATKAALLAETSVSVSTETEPETVETPAEPVAA